MGVTGLTREALQNAQVVAQAAEEVVVTGPGPVRKRGRASTVNYKQLAGLDTRNRRSKEEIMKEKAEKEDKREGRAKKTRRVHAETAEGWWEL
jgi:hypothetical protein